MTPIERADLKGKVDQFLIDRLLTGKGSLQRVLMTPRLTWNRFDLAFKLVYLRALGNPAETFATSLYDAHILAFSLGSAQEPGNARKVGLDRFRAEFRAILDSLGQDGFDPSLSLVPLARDGSPLNGAHRVSAAMALGRPVAAVETELDPMIFDQRYFRSRGVSEHFLAAAALCAAEVTPGSVVTVSASGRRAKARERPIYSQSITLTPQGLRNLALQLGAKDVARAATGFGTTLPHNVRVDLWGATGDTGTGVQGQIFASRTQEGALALARLLFNANSRHHLNAVELRPDDAVWRLARDAGSGAPGAFAFDMEMVLAAYGIRDPRQVDYRGPSALPVRLAAVKCTLPHAESDGDIMADPRHHFFAFGQRFIALRLVADTLKRQGVRTDTDVLAAASNLREPEPEQLAGLPEARLRYHRMRAALIAVAFRLGFGELLRRVYRRIHR